MRIVVTGARGFIGSVFCRRASELGHVVLALDNESRGLNLVDGLERVVYRRYDCAAGLAEILPEHGFHPDVVNGQLDAVVHLAAGTGSLDRPYAELIGLNIEMTQRVYHDAVAAGAKAFVFPTTSLGIEESLKDSPYVKSKDDAMRWLLDTDDPWRIERKASDLRQGIAIPVRFFNVSGAYKGATEFRQKEVHMLPTLVDAYREKRLFIINGQDYETRDGTPGRDFINVLDLVNVLLELIAMRVNSYPLLRNLLTGFVTPANDGAIHCGTGYQTTTKEAVALFRQHIGPVEWSYGPRRAYDCGGLQIDAEQARQYCRFIPGGLPTPFWVSLRDEAHALLDGPRLPWS